MKHAGIWLVVTLGWMGGLQQPQQPTFRATADAVFVDVGVSANRRTVSGLTRGDFSLTDNGVAQEIDEISVATDPVDVELLVDTGSELAALRPAILRDVAAVRSLLMPGDRSALVTFDSQIRVGSAPGEPAARGEQGTVLFDAIATTLMQLQTPGRRRAIVVVTAGLDTHSLVSATTRRQILERSEPPVYLIASGQRPTAVTMSVGSGPGGMTQENSATTAIDHTPALREIADMTGGRLYDLQAGDSFITQLREALMDFRTRYVLRYHPRGVAASGWHALGVRLTRAGSYDVRARRGYWRD